MYQYYHRQALLKGFFGPAKGGVYSPAVQYTVYDMGSLVLDAVPEVRGWCFVDVLLSVCVYVWLMRAVLSLVVQFV